MNSSNIFYRNNISVIPDHSFLNDAYNPQDHAIVSSLYTDDYTIAIMTLGHSIRAVNITARMVLMYIPESEGGGVSQKSLCLVQAAGWTPHPVSFIHPPANKALSGHYRHQYSKLNLWGLDTLGIKSAVYVDADTLVRKNFEVLFTLPWNVAAVPDVFDTVGFVVGINAGVLFFRPNSATFDDMISKLAVAEYPPNYAEQTFLNIYFGSQMDRMPYTFNANLAIKQRSATLWASLQDEIRIVHYTTVKPFPHEMLSAAKEVEFFEKKKNFNGGLWKEEVGWWRHSFNAMRKEVKMEQCDAH